MNRWLLKTEPGTYSWSDLVREKKATWDGVANPLALKHLRAMAKGDVAIIYHTGSERRAVGVAEVAGAPYPDPNEADEKLVVVDLKPKGPLARPVSLDQMKGDPAFANWELLRLPRLSVMPVPEGVWKRIEELAR